jgi:hypothetical protein
MKKINQEGKYVKVVITHLKISQLEEALKPVLEFQNNLSIYGARNRVGIGLSY